MRSNENHSQGAKALTGSRDASIGNGESPKFLTHSATGKWELYNRPQKWIEWSLYAHLDLDVQTNLSLFFYEAHLETPLMSLPQTLPLLRALAIFSLLLLPTSLKAQDKAKEKEDQETKSTSESRPTPPHVQMLVPGFRVRELPIKLTNLINVEYAPDGRLFAAGYDGRMHMMTDTDGDGLEDKVQTFWETTSSDYPLGMVVHDQAVYVLLTAELVRFVDTDGDQVPDKREIVLKDWDDPALAKHPLILRRRVDFGMGLAIGPDGSIYISMGNAAYNNAYMIDKDGKLGDKTKSHYDPKNLRGCVLKFSADGTKKEQILTGVRYLMSMQFNRHGDLFATDQEGATWLPNGNPFDELLHLEPGRHYGFPPAHPKYLPDVIDEPSLFDYAPQHQSLCGFRFNGADGRNAIFGPENWRDNALITGFSRGKLFRTQLAKTESGYVAQNQLVGAFQSMPSDLSLSPNGEMVVSCHTGKPDWGTGPQGSGLLYKISYTKEKMAMPVTVWNAGPGEFQIAFDQPLQGSQIKSWAKELRIEAGEFVFAGDRFETIRPGYEVVKQQVAVKNHSVPALSTSLSADGRNLTIYTPANPVARHYSLTLPGIGRERDPKGDIEQQPSIDLLATLHGVEATWIATSEKDGATTDNATRDKWKGWLPHVDLGISSQFTQGSSQHEALSRVVQQPGRLTLRCQLDLWQMLQPAIQPISKLDYERPLEKTFVVLESPASFQVKSGGELHNSVRSEKGEKVVIEHSGKENQWLPIAIVIPTSKAQPQIGIHWYTDRDPRPRAFPLRKFFLPWAIPLNSESTPKIDRASMTELAGGSWERGRTLYKSEAAQCSKCHQTHGEGNKIGPDLSNLIHRDYDSVLRDIREPSAAVNPDYLNYIVATSDGKVSSGIIHTETPDAITLADNAGKLLTVERSEIEKIQPSPLSVMPQDVAKGLTPDQMRDLMTFLLLERPQ